MSETATPVAPEATPAAAPATPAPASETVTLTKEQHDQLARDAARAGEAQTRADRLAEENKRLRQRPGAIRGQAPAGNDGGDDHVEDAKAEREILRLAGDPSIREILDADPTLQRLITSDPLALVRMYADNPLDAEDAVSQVKDKLLERKSTLKKADPAPTTPAPSTPPAIPGRAPNPAPKDLATELETAQKNPSTQGAAADMIRAKMRSR